MTFIATGDKSAHFFAPVNEQVWVTQVGEFIGHTFDGFSEDVQMRHGDDRQVEPNHFANFASPHTGGVDHDLGLDRAFVCHHFADTPVDYIDLFNISIEEETCTTVLGTDGESIG